MTKDRAGIAADFGLVLAKRRWASHHLALLELAVADYVSTGPFVSVIEDHPSAEEYQILAKLRYPPPQSISLITGDVLSNLRGALDHLAWQLVLLEGRMPGRPTQFPIKNDLKKDGSEPPVNIRDADGQGVIDPAGVEFLRSVQPYKNGPESAGTHPLEVLRRLNDEAKHRHLTVLATAAAPPPIYGVGATIGIPHPSYRAKEGEEVGVLRYEWLPNGEPPDGIELTTDVTLESIARHATTGRPLTVVEVLVDISMFVDRFILGPTSALFRMD